MYTVHAQGHKYITCCCVSENPLTGMAVMGEMMGRTVGEDSGTGCKEVRGMLRSKSMEAFVGEQENFRSDVGLGVTKGWSGLDVQPGSCSSGDSVADVWTYCSLARASQVPIILVGAVWATESAPDKWSLEMFVRWMFLPSFLYLLCNFFSWDVWKKNPRVKMLNFVIYFNAFKILLSKLVHLFLRKVWLSWCFVNVHFVTTKSSFLSHFL